MELAELLDKQENEINSLQQELEIQKGCSISKDKIREKIEESKEMITNEFVCETYKDRYEFLVKYLEELLQDKE